MPKFKVWDKKTKSMWNIESWHVEDEYFDLIEPNKSVADPNANRVWRKQNEVIPMQSTGLYDRHGVEIFQGDVVKIVYDGEPFTGVVVYDLGEAEFKATNGHEDYGNNFQYLTVGESIEVIGNIYENPELLEYV